MSDVIEELELLYARRQAQTSETKRPYALTEDAFELLHDTRNALFLLGALVVEQNPKAGDLPAEEMGSTLLRLSRQLKQVMQDAGAGV